MSQIFRRFLNRFRRAPAVDWHENGQSGYCYHERLALAQDFARDLMAPGVRGLVIEGPGLIGKSHFFANELKSALERDFDVCVVSPLAPCTRDDKINALLEALSGKQIVVALDDLESVLRSPEGRDVVALFTGANGALEHVVPSSLRLLLIETTPIAVGRPLGVMPGFKRRVMPALDVGFLCRQRAFWPTGAAPSMATMEVAFARLLKRPNEFMRVCVRLRERTHSDSDRLMRRYVDAIVEDYRRWITLPRFGRTEPMEPWRQSLLHELAARPAWPVQAAVPHTR